MPAPREPGVSLAPPPAVVASAPVMVPPAVAARSDTAIEFVSGPEPGPQRAATPIRERAIVAALPRSEPAAAPPAPVRSSAAPARPVEPDSGAVAPSPRSAAVAPQPTVPGRVGTRTYWVQVGWYRTPDDAARVAAQLNAFGPTAVVGPVTRAQGPYAELPSRVVMGPFATRELAQSAIQRLGTIGIMGSITERRE
jgi:cell division protein FtsN